MLLAHIGDQEGAERIESAIGTVISSGIRTRDIGGSAGTREFGEAVIKALGNCPVGR
jgi:isocitrate/isopropylmalate dehydrogenase